MRLVIFSAVLVSALSGCASIGTGLDSDTKFKCQAPEGVPCMSASGAYMNSLSGNLPGLVSQTSAEAGTKPAASPEALAASMQDAGIKRRTIVNTGTALRSSPRVVRLWIAPWEDSDGDLHDQMYVYLTVDPGRWVIEHNRRNIRPEFAPATLKNVPQSEIAPQPASQQSSANAPTFPAVVTEGKQ